MSTLLIIIFLALAFDFLNGFHDAANSIATVVSTRVLSPRYAVLWAAFFNFIAFLILGLEVATTIGKGLIHSEIVDLTLIGAGLVAAIIWNLITWWLGIPSSSSHTLVGGLVGAAIAKAGFGAVFMGEVQLLLFIFAKICPPFVLIKISGNSNSFLPQLIAWGMGQMMLRK